MRSLIMRVAAVAMVSYLAACESGTPLSSNLVLNSHPSDSSSADAAAPSGGGPVTDDPAKAIPDGADASTGVTTPPSDAASPSVQPESQPESQPELPPEVADGSTHTAAPDASAPADAATEAGPLLSCEALAAAGAPTRLQDFQWEYEVPTVGPYNPPYDYVKIDSGCVLTYQATLMPPSVNSTTRKVTMNAADCAGARGWATNARFLEVLSTGDHCPYGDGNPGDAFELTLTDGEQIRRKTYLCPEPTLEAVRACLRPLVARLFPK